MRNVENTAIKMEALNPNKKGFWNTKRRIVFVSLVMAGYLVFLNL